MVKPVIRSRLIALACTALAGCGGSAATPPDGSAPATDLAASSTDLAQAGGSDGGGGNNGGRLFPPTAPWYTDITKAPPDNESATVIQALQAAGGWGNANRFQVDFSFEVLDADANTPTRTFTKTTEFYSPDCDFQPVPVPPGGAIEGETGYQCLSNGDCHLLVVNRALGKLFEMWRADIRSPMVFNGGCLAVWDMARAYPPNLRGEYCTSADAAGFPITPLLPTADEVFAAVQAQGDVGHALRFILPNSRIRRRVYVHPSTHSTPSTSGGATLPPYGAHFRLRSDYPLGRLPNEAARTIARSLQRFGMFLSDGGDIPVTFRGDRSTKHKWAEMGFDSHSLFGINVTDFDMVDGGARFTWNMDCVRNP